VVKTSPPEEYQLVSSMDAGIAGKLNGVADVQLEALGTQETRLRYRATIDVEGWIGELGVKLLGSTAEGYMQRFFDRMIENIDTQ
jgi:carbon monoxide dehydrogenase subunit G